MAPPPIRSGPSGFSPPPKISAPPELRMGGSGASSSAPARQMSPELRALNCRVTTAADSPIKRLAINSSHESRSPVMALEPTHTPSLSSDDLSTLISARTTPAEVGALARSVLSRPSLSSPEHPSPERLSPERPPKSPDSTEHSSETARIVDKQGRNFDVTIATQTSPAVVGPSRGGVSHITPPVTTSRLTIQQVSEIHPNTNPQMNTPLMEKFIRENIGEAHLQDAKDLISTVINELAKSPATEPVSIDLECGGAKFRLIFDGSKNEVLLFNRKHFVEGTEKTVHDAVAIPLLAPAGVARERDIESRAVLCSKPDMISLLRLGIINATKFHELRPHDPRLQHIISPPKSEYQIISPPKSEELPPEATLIISEERLSGGDLMNEINSDDSTAADFQTHLLEGCIGLSLIHELGFVHCDAKIENFFLKGDTCQVGDLSTCRTQNAAFPPYARDQDPLNARSEDKRSYDILSLGNSLANCIVSLEAKSKTEKSAAFIDRLKALIPLMIDADPAKRPTIGRVIEILTG
ncbi:MAG: hypothetical protein NTX49_04610 [Chlamydiae bacterium]|nr:hypothetical protein [Chlamydiota bacterium]